MLLGFKRRFAPFVRDGSKTHTIRAIRKIPPGAGEICHCYVDPRQKTMELLGRWPCVRVEDIVFDRARVYINGEELSTPEKDLLAWRDGFRHVNRVARERMIERGCFDLMLEFWAKTHKDKALDFRGHLIHWDFNRPARKP